MRQYPLLLRTLGPVLILVVLVIVPYWRIATMQGVMITNDIFTSDLMNDGFPYRMYLGEALKQGEFPLWYPPVYGGFPLLARAESGICFPPAILFFGLLPPFPALNLLILFTVLTAALGMFAYARRVTGSVSAAMIAGVSFAWCGFLVCHLKHLSMAGTVSLFPLGLLALERAAAAAKRGNAAYPSLALFAAVFGLQILAGHIQTAYYAALVYIPYFIVATTRTGKEKTERGRKVSPWWKRAGAALTAGPMRMFALALLLGAGLGAVQLLPTYELVQLSQRSGGVGFDYASAYAYNPANIVTFAVPYANGDISNATYTGRSVFWEDYGYAGLIVLVLAGLALSGWKSSWHVRFFAVAGAAAYCIVLGPATPVYELLFRILPGMQYFRFPTRFLFVVDGALAVLAAFAAARLFRRAASRFADARRWAIPVLLVAAAAGDVILHNMRQNPVVDMDRWAAPPASAAFLARDSTFFRIYTPGSSETHKQAFALARGWSGDLTPYVEQREFLQPSSNVLYGLSSADGYAQLTPSYVVDVWGDQNSKGGLIFSTARVEGGVFRPGVGFVNILSAANVKYLVSPWPFEDSLVVPEGRVAGAYITRNPRVLPRAYMVGAVRRVHSVDAAKEMIAGGEFRAGREAIVYDRIAMDAAADTGACEAAVTHAGSNQVVIRTSAPGERLLVLADTDYPGWAADIDGVPAVIHRANLTQRAVLVPGGEHEVRFRFSPATVHWGLALTLLCALLVAAGGAVSARRGDQRAAERASALQRSARPGRGI